MKIVELAAARGETVEQAEAYLAKMARSMMPGRFTAATDIAGLPVAETGFETTCAWARLSSGRIFFGYHSTPTQLRQYWMIRDKIPKTIKPEAFGVVRDILLRYIGEGSPDHEHLPTDGESAIIIEAGAYLGFKTMRYADRCGENGQVVALEIDRRNFELLARNVAENDLDERVIPLSVGVWSETGERSLPPAHHQRHSLTGEGEGHSVMCATLSDLMSSLELPGVDYLNIQVNGAELHALQGLGRRVDDIRVMDIASQYEVEGEPVRPKVERWLTDHGFAVHQYEPWPNRIIAKRA